MEVQEKCSECGAHKEKFVYDANACEMICSVCGVVLERYDHNSVKTSEFEERGAFLSRIFGLGNPADDVRFLKFLRRKEALWYGN